MNTVETMQPITDTRLAPAPRIVSIDIFRGLTMAVMIFVNELDGVEGLPWWTHHAHASENVMTYVDMVFPFFLFVLGMSLPLSVTQRLKRNPSLPALWLHVFLRFLGLLALGLILANAEKADPARMIISGSNWALLGLISMALNLNTYPPSRRFPRYSTILRSIGIAGAVLTFALFRRAGHDGHAAWIDGSYPEILGLIGYSYLAAAILYIPTRRWKWAPVLWFILLVALCAISTARLVSFPDHLPLYLWPFGNVAMACIIMAGVVTSIIFLGTDRRPSPRNAMLIAAGFALLTFAAGWALTPLGISKIRATPTWSLYSIAASILLFTLLYWICDVKQHKRWALLIEPAGANTLTTYLLPDLWYFLLASLGVTFFDTHFGMGWPGVLKTLVFTLFILAAAALLTRLRIRLRL
jgi:heparan-alpha-glucosaminide N-acetyltransferase